MIEDKNIFAAIRVRGNIKETGKWNKNECDYVDIDITKWEAERIAKFLTNCIITHNSSVNLEG